MHSKNFGTLIGSFGKGIKGSVTVNFGISGGSNCDDSCTLKGNGCYAITTEAVKPSITVNLERKQNNLTQYLTELTSPKALAKFNAAPWIRASAFGSIPAPEQITDDQYSLLKDLATGITNKAIHWPVETLDKARLLRSVGFNPRYSAGLDVSKAISAVIQGFNTSVVIQGPKRATGKNKRKHSEPAFIAMKDLSSQGITSKVCPAIAGSAKCGACKLCADPKIDVIIYPMH
jgi:hypothetical protein